MSENLEEKKKKSLDDDQLDEAAGGGWGSHTYSYESQYNGAKIRTDWTYWISKDKFYWTPPGSDKEIQIDKGAAANIVFFQHKTGRQPKDLGEANKYKNDHIDLFEQDVKASNKD